MQLGGPSNTVMPLRVIYRQALDDGLVGLSPVERLRLPAVRGRRDRIATPIEAAALLDTLPTHDKAIWATALYGGLRRGELMALRWEDVDLASGVIRVERSWDSKSKLIVEPKSRAGRRQVPIATALQDYLVEHVEKGGQLNGGSEDFGRRVGQVLQLIVATQEYQFA